MKEKRIWIILWGLAFFILTTGFSFAADPALIKAAKKEGEVVVYTNFVRRFLDPIGKYFKEMYNLGDDFKVTFTRKGTGAIIQMIEAEHMSGKSKWDCIEQSDEGAFLRWIQQGMLMKYQPPNIGNIYKEFWDDSGYRVAGQINITSIGLNKKRVPEKDWPKSYKDLLDPKWKGRIGLSNPATAGPGELTAKYMVDLYGWDFFRKLGRNKPILTKGNSALEQLLLSGEIDIALTPNEFSILERIKNGETNLKIIYPEEGVAYYVVWAAINKDARHPNAAKLWMEYNASNERQKFVSEKAARYITNKNVKLAYPRPPLKFHKIDWEWMRAHKNELCDRFTREIEKGRSE
jgi:iron(III) transport system substrate-binding protein